MDYRLFDQWLTEAEELPSPERDTILEELTNIMSSLRDTNARLNNNHT